jgi:hypothetical protein
MARAGSLTRLATIPALALTILAALAVCAGAALADPGTPGPVTGLASPSHADESTWYSSANPSFSWNPAIATNSAIAGYSFVFDQNPSTIPDTTSDRVSLSFLPRVPITVGTSPTEDRVADLNGDGKLDIVLENSGSNTISVLIGNGDGTFQPRADYATGTQPWSMDLGDLNGDGKLDVVTCNLAASSASVLINNGDGTFKAKADFTTGAGSVPECLRLGDVNGDNKLDILTANAGTNNVGVLLGSGDGAFGGPATFSTATHPTSIDMGDLNHDGKLDLVTANYTTNNVSVLMGVGNGTFQAAVNYACGSQPETIVVADLNRDGWADVATVNYSPACASILLNNGNGTLAPRVDYVTGGGPYSLDVLDLNRDGAPDLVTTNHAASTESILFGNGDGTFTAKTDLATGNGPFWVALGDLTGDGYGDLVTTDQSDGTISVYAGTAFLAASFTGKADGEWYFHVRAVDSLGVGGPPATRTVRIDTTRPTTTPEGLRASATTGWQTTSQPVTLTGDDAGGSGVAAIRYTLDGGAPQSYTDPFSVSGSASHTIVYWSVDKAGNMEAVQTGFVNIDTDAPVTSASGLAANADADWRTSSKLVTLTPGDGTGSGVAATSFKIDSGVWQPYSGPFTVDGDGSHTVAYFSTDAVGNPEDIRTGFVNIDTTPPTTGADGLQTSATVGWQNHAQQVTLSANDGAGSGLAATYYTLDGGAQQTYGAPFTVSGQASHEVRYWSTDAVGNPEAAHTGYVNIDTTAPTTTADGLQTTVSTGWQTTSQQVTLSGADTGGFGPATTCYTVDGGALQMYSGPFTVGGSASHTVVYWSVDRAGNTETAHTGFVNIDTDAPNTVDNGLALNDHSGWQNHAQQVALSANDGAGSGLAATYYTLDGGAQQTYGAPFTVSDQGSHEVMYWSTDAVGNPEAAHTGYVNIDTDAPTTTANGLAANDHSGWRTASQQVDLSGADIGGSGLAITYYTLDGGDAQTYTDTFMVSGSASHTVVYWSVDKAGNAETAHTGFVNIGVSMRQTTASGLRTSSLMGWQNHPQQVTLSANDAGGSSLAVTYYTLDGGSQQTYGAPFTVSDQGSHEVIYWSTDAVGNPESTHTGYVNIDTTVPTVTDDAPGGWSATPVTVQLHPADAGGSGLTATQYCLHGTADWSSTAGGAFTVPAPGNGSNDGVHLYDYRALDGAGNVSGTGSCSVSIDTTAPVVTNDADAYWHNSPVTVNLAAGDPGAGMTGGSSSLAYKLTSDNGAPSTRSWTQASAGTAAVTIAAPTDGLAHTYVFAYQASDALGKQTTGQFTVRMDTRRPATSVSGLPATPWTNKPVTLIFAAAPGDGAPIARTEYSLNAGATWTPIVPTAGGALALSIATPGATTVLCRSVNTAGTTEDPARTATVQIDTGKPACLALKNVKVKAKKLAKLPFRIKDPAPSCGAAQVTITIYRSKKVGKRTVLKVAKRITIKGAVANKNLVYKYKVRLKKGSYTWSVTATDAAGNVGAMSKLKKLTVK